jgi:hypothetical protein
VIEGPPFVGVARSAATSERSPRTVALLFCNEAGHFKAGMYATFTVAP